MVLGLGTGGGRAGQFGRLNQFDPRKKGLAFSAMQKKGAGRRITVHFERNPGPIVGACVAFVRGETPDGASSLSVPPLGAAKAMAAEVLANELSLEFCHIDLAQVVNKFISETEKNQGAASSTKRMRCSASATRWPTSTTATPTSR